MKIRYLHNMNRSFGMGGGNKYIFRVSTEIHVVCSEKTAGKKRYSDTWTHHAHQSLKIKADCLFFVSTLSDFVFYDYIIISFVKVLSLILEWRRCISRCNLPRFSYSDFASKPIFQFFFSKFYSATIRMNNLPMTNVYILFLRKTGSTEIENY